MTYSGQGDGTWAFNGVDLNQLTGGQVTHMEEGQASLPPLRGIDVPMASFPGQRFVEKQHDGRRFSLGLRVMQGATPTAIHATKDALISAFAVKDLRALVQHHPDGTVRTAQAQVVQWLPKGDPAKTGVTYYAVADFFLPDPYFYTAGVVDSARDVSASPTTFNFTHPGTVRGHKVLFDILGPAVNPQILNNTNGVSVQCLVTVAATKHLLIDSGAWTALNDGVQAIGSIRHSGAFPFMVFEPGVNALSWTATGLSSASRLTTTFSPPWL